mgnify:CR=1 FL=1
MGTDPAPEFAADCRRVTGGNPLLLDELARALQADGVRPDAASVAAIATLGPRAVSRTVLARLAHAGPQAIAVAQALAVIGDWEGVAMVEAVDRVRSRGIDVCVHLVCGFPDESREQMLGYADRLNRLDIRFVKLHHLHVVRGTRLAKEYSVRPFPLFSAREWAEFTAEFLESLHPRIVLQRLFGWTSRRFLVAPVWPYSRAELHRLIEEVLEERDAWQGKRLGYELNRSAEGFSLEGDDGYL